MKNHHYDILIVIVTFLCFIIAFTGIGVVLQTIYQIYNVPNPVTFHEDSIHIITPKVLPSGELRYTLKVDKFGMYPATISTVLISKDRKKVYAMPPETGALPPGNYDFILETVIPKHVDPGEYSLFRIYLYSVNRQSVVVRYFETPFFEVVAK
jgi:hypothetical protein